MVRRLLLLAPLPLAILVAAACGGDDSAAPPTTSADAGNDAAPDVTVTPPKDSGLQFIDAAVANCQLQSNDPVALCVQKRIILGEHAVFDPQHGVPSAWDALTGAPATNDAGATAHSWTDDVGYGAMLGEYWASALPYGDTEIQTLVGNDMHALAAIVEQELTPLPASYDGLQYLRLRHYAIGLRLASYLDDAKAIDAIADAWGRSLYTTWFHKLSGAPGSDAGTGDDGGADAGGSDAGDAGPIFAITDGMFGTAGATPDAIAYDSGHAAMAAAALLDMSGRASTGALPDAGIDTTDAVVWLRAAQAVLTHLDARARDASGLYIPQLVTSADPGHDALDPASAYPAGRVDADVQATVALAYTRAQGIIAHYGIQQLATYPVADRASALLHALQTYSPSFWDAQDTPASTALCTLIKAPSCGSGFFAFADGSQMDQHKTVRANAFLFGAMHRAKLVVPVAESDLTPLRAILTTTSGVNDAFLSVLFKQTSYIPVVTRDFQLAADAGLPNATSYSAAANADAVDGLNDQWVGVPQAPASFF